MNGKVNLDIICANVSLILGLYIPRSEAKVSKKQKKEKVEAEDVEKADKKTEGKRRLGKEIAIADHEGFIEVTRVRLFGF